MYRHCYLISYLITLFIFIFFGNLIFKLSAGPQRNSSFEFSSQAEVLKKINYRGPIDDCLLDGSIYNSDNSLQKDCTLNYVHYYPSENLKFKKNDVRSNKELKIGSFNLFHLGDNQAPMKSFSIIAEIMNQWDIVAGQEMMPLSLDEADNNQQLSNLIAKSTPVIFPFKNWSVTKPGYLEVLYELQKLDSSWALIMQSTSEGEGGSGEMAGFFYRSSGVQLKEWDYCPYDKSFNFQSNKQSLNLGCLTQVPEDVKKLTSRLAFAAYFQSANFDFIGLTAHIRFRPSAVEDEVAAQKKAICNQHTDPKKCKISKEFVGRFYEVFAVANQIGLMKEKAHDADVIFMGDFNLELRPRLLDIWKAALVQATGLEPFQKAPTTVGIKFSKMISSYDHFIFNKKLTAECDPATAKPFYVIQAGQLQENNVGSQINHFFSAEQRLRFAQEKKDQADTLVKVDKSNLGTIVRGLTEVEKKAAFGNIDAALESMNFNDYALALHLVSDHIPVEITCTKDQQDDD